MVSGAKKRQIEVEFLSPFHEITKIRKMPLEIEKNEPLETAVERISGRFGKKFEEKLYTERNELSENAILIHNGNVIGSREKMKIKLKDGDKLVFTIPMSGG